MTDTATSTAEPTTETPQVTPDGITVNPDKSVTFHVEGKNYVIPKMTRDEVAADYEAINLYLQSDKRDPMEAAVPELEKLNAFPKYQDKLLKLAWEDVKKGKKQRAITNEEIQSWMDTIPGILFSMGLIFRRRYQGLSDADLLEILMKVGSGEMEKARTFLTDARDVLAEDGLKSLLSEKDKKRIYGGK